MAAGSFPSPPRSPHASAPPPPGQVSGPPSRSGPGHGRAGRGGRSFLDAWATPEIQNTLLVLAVLAAAVLTALVGQAAPTGLDVVDELWVGGFAAVVAYFAGYARRWTWFLPAGAGALLAADDLALGCAAAAIALGFLSVLRDSRSRPYAGVVAGFGMAALMRTEAVGFHGATALLAAIVVLPVIYSGYKLSGRRARRRIRLVATWSAGLLLVMLGGATVGVVTVADDLSQGARLIDQGIAAARDADDVAAQTHLAEASRHMHSAEGTLTSWFVQPAQGLPFVGPNIRAVSEMARDTASATQASSAAAAAADLEHLRFEDGRLDPRRIERMVPLLDDVVESADVAQDTAGRVQSPWLVAPVRDRLDDLDEQVHVNRPDLERALAAVEVAAPLIGGDGDRRYLVLFTTPVEARGRTGFPGNYAELTFEDGRLAMPEFGRITELERAGDVEARVISGPEEFLERYGRFDPAVTWRNIVMSPDFPTIADVAMELYPQSGGREVDGVLTVDPTGLAALMHFTGPVELEELDEPLTADNVERFLHRDQYLQYDNSNQERIDFLEDVAEEVFSRLTEASLPAPSELVDVLGPAAEGNHIQFTTRFEEEAAYFAEIGVDGAFPPPTVDAVAVTTTNAGPNKIDVFLNRELRYDVTWDPERGRVDATLTATLRNQAPEAGLPEYLLGNRHGLPWGYNVAYVSLYSPWLLDEARLDGEVVALHPERELGRYAYSTFVEIPPGGEVVIELDLSDRWAEPLYALRLDPAPLVSAEEASVTVTVAGGQELTTVADDGWVQEGRTLRWSGSLVRPEELVLGLPEAAPILDQLVP